MALTSGTRLGPYEITSAIGAGGVGEVYRARDTRLDREVDGTTRFSWISGCPRTAHTKASRKSRFTRTETEFMLCGSTMPCWGIAQVERWA